MALARGAGAGRIFVTDKLDYRLALAKRLGADEAVNVTKEDPVAFVSRRTGGRLADLSMDCTNKAAGAPLAYGMAGVGGRVALVGIPEEDEIVLDAHVPRRKELSVQHIRRSRHALRQAVDLVASKRLDVASWVTHRVGLDEARKAFDMGADYADGVLTAVVLP